MAVEVGSQAPDFTLKDQHGKEVALSSFRAEKNVLVMFYPFAFSGICTTELCQVRDDLPRYQNDSVQLLGVSVDSPFTLKAYAEKEGYQFPLLADFWPHGAVAQQYGVFNQQVGMAIRGTFLVDRQGVVRFSEAKPPGEARDQSAWQKALGNLG